jgi:hypothetical protein
MKSSTEKMKSKSDRKNSWVMLAESGGYTPLPGEQTLYQSPPRTTLSLQTSHRHPPSSSYSQQCKSGVVYLTNRRVRRPTHQPASQLTPKPQIIYLPVTPTPPLQSFAVPILNVTDSRVTAPWFGANKWEALIQPVAGGGIPSQHAELDMVMEFKEGGAFDFASTFERLKERLRQAVDVARESDPEATAVNMGSVHLDDLPAYEESGGHERVRDAAPPLERAEAAVISQPEPTSPQRASAVERPQAPPGFQAPDEPPPGYEEVQRGSIVDELERQARRMSND